MLSYKVKIDNDVKRNLNNFKNEVSKILNDSKSWKIKFLEKEEDYDFEIILTTSKKIKEICYFNGLSCADISKKIIYINNNRWCRGSVKSQLSLKDYRIYLILHEVGHILGLNHKKPIKNKKVSVMVQQTLGIGDGKPNPWPLKSDHKDVII